MFQDTNKYQTLSVYVLGKRHATRSPAETTAWNDELLSSGDNAGT